MEKSDRFGTVEIVSAPVATVLLVFGRGVTTAGDRYVLTPAGAARVDAAVGYVLGHAAAFAAAAAPLVVFSGGWAEASRGAPRPPEGCREGDLMVARARGIDALRLVKVYIRRRADYPRVAERVGASLPRAKALFLESDICRADLLVEIEGIAGREHR